MFFKMVQIGLLQHKVDNISMPNIATLSGCAHVAHVQQPCCNIYYKMQDGAIRRNKFTICGTHTYVTKFVILHWNEDHIARLSTETLFCIVKIIFKIITPGDMNVPKRNEQKQMLCVQTKMLHSLGNVIHIVIMCSY